MLKALMVAMIVAFCGCVRADTPASQPSPKQWDEPPKMTIDPNKDYTATIETSKGKIVCQLYAKDAPITVNNFVFLATNRYYEGIVFHRIIQGFVCQGGDPEGSGRGGPGYKFQDEEVKTPYELGSLAMANAGPNTNGSQFFIVTAAETPWLDGKHTVFGRITDGMDVVDRMESAATTSVTRASMCIAASRWKPWWRQSRTSSTTIWKRCRRVISRCVRARAISTRSGCCSG